MKLTADMNPLAIDANDKNAWDDKIVNGEFHIPVNKVVLMYFRSKDVIHSAYMPHFRAQMNCVPGYENRVSLYTYNNNCSNERKN